MGGSLQCIKISHDTAVIISVVNKADKENEVYNTAFKLIHRRICIITDIIHIHITLCIGLSWYVLNVKDPNLLSTERKICPLTMCMLT
jgi:hypothetical protein